MLLIRVNSTSRIIPNITAKLNIILKNPKGGERGAPDDFCNINAQANKHFHLCVSLAFLSTLLKSHVVPLFWIWS